MGKITDQTGEAITDQDGHGIYDEAGIAEEISATLTVSGELHKKLFETVEGNL